MSRARAAAREGRQRPSGCRRAMSCGSPRGSPGWPRPTDAATLAVTSRLHGPLVGARRGREGIQMCVEPGDDAVERLLLLGFVVQLVVQPVVDLHGEVRGAGIGADDLAGCRGD